MTKLANSPFRGGLAVMLVCQLTGCQLEDEPLLEDDFSGAEVVLTIDDVTRDYRATTVIPATTLAEGFQLTQDDVTVGLEFSDRTLGSRDFPDTFFRWTRFDGTVFWSQPDCGPFRSTITGEGYEILWGRFSGTVCGAQQDDGSFADSIEVTGEFTFEP